MDLLQIMYEVTVISLGVLAFLVIPSVLYLRSLHTDDSSEPKNVFLRVLSQSAVLINVSAFLVTVLVAVRYFKIFNGEPAEFSLTGLVLIFILAAIITIPWRMANAMRNIGGTASDIPAPEKPLTQNQSEDLRMGKQRREMEADHIATRAKLDKGK